MNFQAVIIDLMLLIVIGLFVFLSAKRGFVRVAVEAVGFIAAVILTLTVCTPLANTTYDKIVEPRVIKTVNNEMESILNGAGESALDKLPDFAKDYINKAGGIDKFIEENEELISDSKSDYIADMSQNTVKPIAVSVLSSIYSAVILTLALILVKVLARFLNKAFSFSIVGKANTALGGVCGAVKGIAVVVVICFIINLLVPITENGIWIFNSENIEKTYIFRFLISLGEF